MAKRSLGDLQRLARVLGRSAGVGFANSMIEAEEQASRQLPPTKAQAILDVIAGGFEGWLREVLTRSRKEEGPLQAKLIELVQAHQQAVMEDTRDGA